MISVKDLSKRYARNTAVDHISFEVERGQIVGFLGPNGAGKTTTMRMLTCFLPPSAGTATVAGFDVLEEPLEVKKRIGYLPETPPIYPEAQRVVGGRTRKTRRLCVRALRGVRGKKQTSGETLQRVPAASGAGAGHRSQSRCADSR